MEFGFEDLVAQVEREGGDALEQLKAATAKSKEVSAMADALLDHFVEKGREAGLTWAQIGEALNVSKQAAQQRSTRFFKGLPHQKALEVLRHLGSKPAFGRFTDKARRVMAEAMDVAKSMNHNYIGTEHLLVALFRVGGVGGDALSSFGLTEDAVTSQIMSKVGRGARSVTGNVPFTPRAKTVLELSLREALQLGHNYIGTEHLALALMVEESLASAILEEAGVARGALRARVVEILQGYGKPAPGEGQADQA